MEPPEVHYARSGDVSIAYHILGEGPPDIVVIRGLAGELLASWEQPLMARMFQSFATFGRVLLIDKRGTGLSDRVSGVPTLETRMDDVRAVMDAVGSEQAVLWTAQEGSRLATLFAATYPERTMGLVVIDPTVKGLPTPDYPWTWSTGVWSERLSDVRSNWGTREFFHRLLREWAPDRADDPDFQRWFVTYMRRSLSPGAAAALYRMMMDSDVSDVLGAVHVPALVMYSPPERAPAEYFARRVPNAELVELPTMRGVYTWVDDTSNERCVAATEAFVGRLHHPREPERILTTLLFTDIVASTEMGSRLGDHAWRDLLQQHHATVRHALARFRGEEQDTAGDGFYARFDGPARAVMCAQEIVGAIEQLGIQIRAGIHTGECELIDGKAAGVSVSIAARVASEAGPSEVLVSQTVKDLVAGSDLSFEDAGEHELKGVPDRWRLYRVVA
ncbi:MAG TPA: adenylate/guanylate cyclase domain-containing protein [Actinomycetota bacterium]|nr:adenylate/guanylate cyclase domain-containing protein [Actinomycetota bacterium]